MNDKRALRLVDRDEVFKEPARTSVLGFPVVLDESMPEDRIDVRDGQGRTIGALVEVSPDRWISVLVERGKLLDQKHRDVSVSYVAPRWFRPPHPDRCTCGKKLDDPTNGCFAFLTKEGTWEIRCHRS